MILKEGHWVGTGTYFSAEEKILMPVECVFDVKSNGTNYEIVGIWHNNSGGAKHGFVLKWKRTELLCDLSLIYDGHIFLGSLSTRQDPFIGTLHSRDKKMSLGISFSGINHGYTFRGLVQHDDFCFHWNVALFENNNPVQIHDKTKPLINCA